VGDRFLEWHLTLLIEPHEVVVHLNMLEQVGVSPGRVHVNVRSRPQIINPGDIKEIGQLRL
jgi:hypothetical protein